MSRGLRARSTSAAIPNRSITPGRKFSTTTSQLVGKLQQQVATLRLRQVDADASLARVLLREVTGDAVGPRVRRAGDVALGWFDLDDVGTEIAQHPGGVRAGQHSREIEHPYSVQRPLGHGATLPAGVRVGVAEVQLDDVPVDRRRRRGTAPTQPRGP